MQLFAFCQNEYNRILCSTHHPYKPRPGWCRTFFLVFRAPAPLHFDNETARDKRAQSRSTPARAHPPSTGAADRWGEGLNRISVNASFEWIFDCVVYDWIYFLPAPAFFCRWLRRNFANPSYILYARSAFCFFFNFTCYCCCRAP